jgi:hypothetical protein
MSASFAAVYQCPFARFPHPYGNRLHNAAAVRRAVTRLIIQMQAGKTVRAVVAVVAACSAGGDEPAADFASERICAGVRFIIIFIVFFPLVFTIHGGVSPFLSVIIVFHNLWTIKKHPLCGGVQVFHGFWHTKTKGK